MSAEESKFEKEDLPRILLALKDARDRGETCAVVVQFADNGGVISVVREAKKRYK